MTEFPLQLNDLLGHWESYIVYLIIGIAFGVVLEIAGFGNSKKLAAQFYFKEMTVLKVMFSAIIVAMLLIFLSVSIGLLDYRLIWVNPTYLWPGIVGGLIMGAGFIIGGFCPGTSLVAAATAKLDGVFFVAGAFFGIFLFGETVGYFEDFWNSSYYGRLTIQDWLGLDAGVVALAIILMALMAFWASEHAERIFGGMSIAQAPNWRYAAAAALAIGAFGLAYIGQPSTQDKWNWMEDEQGDLLADRKVQIHPGELLGLIHDNKISLRMLDVRSEADFNLFHILDAEHTSPTEIPDLLDEFHEAPANTVFVVMSNGETVATEVWKDLVAESVPNVYILEGGINNWIDTFAANEFKTDTTLVSFQPEQLRYGFDAALGDRHPAANPNPDVFEDLEFETKVVLKAKRGATGGGCG